MKVLYYGIPVTSEAYINIHANIVQPLKMDKACYVYQSRYVISHYTRTSRGQATGDAKALGTKDQRKR